MTDQTARTLTPLEHDRAWHAVEGAEDPDPGTILAAVLRALRINAPTVEDEQAASPRLRDAARQAARQTPTTGGDGQCGQWGGCVLPAGHSGAHRHRPRPAAEQPDPTTADTITSDALDRLYDLLDNWERASREKRDLYAAMAQRAEQAEAALEQAQLDAEQQERNFRALMNERTSYREAWKYEQGRRAKAEAAIERIRAVLDRIERARQHLHGITEPMPTGISLGLDDAAQALRAALDEHQEQPG